MKNLLPISQKCLALFAFLILSLLCNNDLFAQSPATYTNIGTNNWVAPAGVTSITVESWGGGGGGGGAKKNSAGGGGGGGAYSKATSVTVSALAGSYNVVVGSGGAGGNGNIDGNNGNSSYFNINTAIADGGKGGSSGGNGGTGGTGGTGTYFGGAGADGVISSYSGGGGGGAGSTGAGGNASGSTAGTGTTIGGGNGATGRTSNNDGSNGNTYGGGGSGGFRTNSKGQQSGGDGAQGQLIITWSNVTYSLTNTNVATAPCIGSPATVTLTGTVASLPTGVYTVTYSLTGANSGANLTTNFTVNTAGTGSFNTVNLATVGSTNISITNLASGNAGTNGTGYGCNSAITTNNTNSFMVQNLPAQPGTISGGTSVCQGSSQSYTITPVGGITYNWNTPAGWVLNSGQGTNTVNYTTGSSSGTVSVVASNGSCSSTARTLSVSINPVPAQPSAISGAVAVCSGSIQTYSVTNVAGVSYTWNIPTGWVINSGQGTNTISYTVGSSGGTVQVTPSNACGNGTASTLPVLVNATLYWGGIGTSMTGGTTGTNFNDAANWSTNASTFTAAGISPTSCNNVEMNIWLNGATKSAAITFSNTNTSFNNFKSNLIDKLGSGSTYSFSLALTTNQTVTVLGTSNFYTENNTNNRTTQTEINVNGANSVWTYTGDITASSVNNATNVTNSEADNYIFSNAVGTSNMGKVVIKGNANLGGMGDDAHPQLNKPALLVFDGTGTQTITNNTTIYPIYLGFNTQIGEFNTPTVVLNGSGPNGFQVIKNLTISPNCTLDINSTQSINDTVTTLGNTSGVLTLGANATLKIGGTSLGQTGSNFPLGFTSYSFDATSTVNYYAGNTTSQKVFATPVYGNLSLSNIDGAGLSNKTSTAAISAAGTTTVNGYVRFTPGANFTTGGAFNILNNGELYCGTNIISGSGSFNLNQGGTIAIGSNAGISASGATGNITNSGTRIFNNDANYIYNGTVNQASGSGLNNTFGTGSTNGVRTLTINNTGTSANNIVYLSGNVQVNNNLNMVQGIFNIATGNTLYIRNTMSRTSGLIDETDGSLCMNGSTAQSISGNIFTNKTVNNLVISNTASGTVLTVGSTSADSLKIKNLLSFAGVTGKTFATGDNLTILSTAGYTASIGDLTGNIISGKVSVERYINTGVGAGQHAQTWQLLSTPTVGQSIYNSWQEGGAAISGRGAWLTGTSGSSGFDAITAGASLKYYNSATNQYTGVVNTASTITLPNGYYVFIRGDRSVKLPANTPVPTILRTTGTIYQPTAPAPSVTVPVGKFATVGNPYASAIDLNYMKTNGYFSNLNNDVIVWDPSLAGSYGAGIFQTLSATNNYVPTAGSPSSYYPSGVPHPYIQSGQAFFVHTATGAVSNGSVSFAEGIKYTSGNMLVNGVTGANPLDRQYIRATLNTNTGLVIDGNAVVLDKEFTNSINADDALKINNSGENFGIKSNGITLAVEAHALMDNADTVMYQLQNLKMQDYQLRFGPENLHGNLRVSLIDNYLNKATILSNTDTSIVPFTITADAASAAGNRFMLVFSPQNILPVKITSITASRANDKTVKLLWQVENETAIKNYEIQRSKDKINFETIGTQLPLNNKAGAYLYSFTDAGAAINADYYYRILSRDIDTKTSYSNLASVAAIHAAGTFITVSPNPVIDKTVHLQFTGMPLSAYHFEIVSPTGQLIYQDNIETQVTDFNKIIYLNKNIQSGIYQLIIENREHVKTIKKLMIN
ncbi:MAG: hypothetical protein JSU03_04010 [Bacteroidetes bacterium]|nr:hypothetical protein [Bacteroidota bacterium]MBS1756419.1 hypothetical protein [Bacteroidota bacterium]